MVSRYVARRPFATERLEELSDGRVQYRLAHPWSDGTTAIVYEPLELIERLVALVPPPGFHRVRYHGVLTPAAPERPEVVPTVCTSKESKARNYCWAELMQGAWDLYSEVRHPRLSAAAVMAVQTVESLTHRFAAHPGQGLPRDAFAAELVGMLEAYLTRAAR